MRSFVLIVLFLLSEAIGIVFGELYFHLYLKAIPPMAHSDFNAGASRLMHDLYGAGLGVVIFLWALVGMGTGSLLRRSPKPQTK
jgi:hypothetical protein